ncbi:hypothetical protein NLG97_g2281 [Lecanicillium saksenae]|uniref:Uncharacterized protein n=1 Tax=Lecanicillium saksenae TaxID=468837 RepID=A0ACC1R3Z0_9HYPO|nr:hypothetical protein NLG97_g2281 [Lecanicillium saksenae]
MRQSRYDGAFWTVYAARESFAFDAIFWEKLDRKKFGNGGALEDAWKARLNLLDNQIVEDMEHLVEEKLRNMETRELVWEPDEL